VDELPFLDPHYPFAVAGKLDVVPADENLEVVETFLKVGGHNELGVGVKIEEEHLGILHEEKEPRAAFAKNKSFLRSRHQINILT